MTNMRIEHGSQLPEEPKKFVLIRRVESPVSSKLFLRGLAAVEHFREAFAAPFRQSNIILDLGDNTVLVEREIKKSSGSTEK